MASAWATRAADPAKAISLMTSISSSAVPDTGTAIARWVRSDRILLFAAADNRAITRGNPFPPLTRVADPFPSQNADVWRSRQ